MKEKLIIYLQNKFYDLPAWDNEYTKEMLDKIANDIIKIVKEKDHEREQI